MALTTYRSKVAITSAALRDAAYTSLEIMFEHLKSNSLNLVCSRVQLMGDNFIEVDFSNPLPVAQVDHLGLQGPV